MRYLGWWPFRGTGIPTYKADTTIGKGASVRGDLRGPGGFRINGDVQGTIEADGPVVIGAEGSVEGAVRGRDVVVLGRVQGDVHASGHLEIGPNGCVIGDITVTSIRVHAGGTLHGASHIGAVAVSNVHRLATSTNPIAVPYNAGELEGLNPRGRTLPPPLGAVPPPAPSPVVMTNPLSGEERSAPRASGETRIEPAHKAAANDSG